MNNRGTVSLVFDDGYEHILHSIVPLLDKYNFPGVFAIPLEGKNLSQETGFAISSVDAWQGITNRGHELAAHGVVHTDLTKLSNEKLTGELSKPAQTLKASTLIYPGGAHNKMVEDEAKKYFKAARGVTRGYESIPPHEIMNLRTFNFTKRNFSLWKANALALKCYLTNDWLIETYHMISDTPDNPYAISPVDFAKHIHFLSKLPISVRTIRSVTSL